MPKPYTTYVSTLFTTILKEVESTGKSVSIQTPITPYIQNRLLNKAKDYEGEIRTLLIQSILSAEVE